MAEAAEKRSLAPLVVGAAGIVFGDIGTSPLYTMKTVLQLGGGQVDGASAMGVRVLASWPRANCSRTRM